MVASAGRSADAGTWSFTPRRLPRHIGQPAISMLLACKARPQRRTVERVACAVGVEPGELWPGFHADTVAGE